MVILMRKMYEAIDSVVFFCCDYYLRTATIAAIMVLLRIWAYPSHTKTYFKAEKTRQAEGFSTERLAAGLVVGLCFTKYLLFLPVHTY